MPENSNKTAPARVIHPGDLIQITDPNHKWFPTVVVADQIKAWGVQAFAYWPSNTDKPSKAHIRLQAGQYEYCGTCVIISEDMNRDRRNSIESHAAMKAEAGK